MKKIFIICLLCLCSIKAQKKISLSDLNLSKVQQPFWNVQKDLGADGRKINLSGKTFNKGIGTISKSNFFVWVGKNAKRFTCKVGIQNKRKNIKNIKYNVLVNGLKLFYTGRGRSKRFVGIGATEKDLDKGSIKFIIKGDGNILWQSKILRTKDAPSAVNIDIKNINFLEFIVTDAGDGISGDNAVWADPFIYYQGKKTPKIVPKNFLANKKRNKEYFNKYLLPKIKQLSEGSKELIEGVKKDYLIKTIETPASIYKTADEKSIVLSNGLVSRKFLLYPNCATVDYKNLSTGETYLRAIRAEASITIDGKTYAIGGVDGQTEQGYLKEEWLEDVYYTENSFVLKDFKTGEITPRINWKNKRWSLIKKHKNKGIHINFIYEHPNLKDIIVNVHYNLWQGIPLISKWISIENRTERTIRLNKYKTEILATSEPESSVANLKNWLLPNIHIESDYSFNSMHSKAANKILHWSTDSLYTSQTNWEIKMPCLLECKLPMDGPDEMIEKGQTHESFRIWELPFDNFDRQRKALATNKFYQTVAPWVTENPLFLHLTTTDNSKVKTAINQCAKVGYEMVILSFGSGLNMEDISEKNIKKYKALADYAHSKGVELGGYSLLSSRWISEEVDVINYKTGKRGGVQHGSSPCLNSDWGIEYFRKLKFFLSKTGFDLLEHDGSYPGQFCASMKHTGHKGLHDSQWKAWKRITNFYKWCNENGISLNIPDWYYLNGSTKNGIGYREVNWSLPRERQLVLGRQNIYDGTWERIPSMSWTFVPLTQYHGGGEEATLEPLKDHLEDYKAHMIQNYGSGVQACYRGPRLYDSKKTKKMVISVVNWYKKYRNILNSPIVHIKRADGRNIDGFMHVNPHLKEKGFALFFNPTDRDLTKKIKIPLYYTGLTSTVEVTDEKGNAKIHSLERDYSIDLKVSVPKRGSAWFVLK